MQDLKRRARRIVTALRKRYPQATTALSGAMEYETEAYFGATFPGIYALIANRHIHEYGTTRKQLSMVAVKNHRNAIHNPYAQYKKKITIARILILLVPVNCPTNPMSAGPIIPANLLLTL